VFTPIVEVGVRPGNEVDDGPRHEDLAGIGQPGHALSEVDGDAGDVVTSKLDLAGVESSAQLQTQLVGTISNRGRARDGSPGAIERRQCAVTDVADEKDRPGALALGDAVAS